MRRLSITFELGESRRYDSFFRRLHCLGAFDAMNSQWFLLTSLAVDEIEKDLRAHLDPADRLCVAHVGTMSSQNLINGDKFATRAS